MEQRNNVPKPVCRMPTSTREQKSSSKCLAMKRRKNPARWNRSVEAQDRSSEGVNKQKPKIWSAKHRVETAGFTSVHTRSNHRAEHGTLQDSDRGVTSLKEKFIAHCTRNLGRQRGVFSGRCYELDFVFVIFKMDNLTKEAKLWQFNYTSTVGLQTAPTKLHTLSPGNLWLEWYRARDFGTHKVGWGCPRSRVAQDEGRRCLWISPIWSTPKKCAGEREEAFERCKWIFGSRRRFPGVWWQDFDTRQRLRVVHFESVMHPKVAQNTRDSKVAQSPRETRKIECLSARKDLHDCDDPSLFHSFKESLHFIGEGLAKSRYFLDGKTRETFISKSRCGCKSKKLCNYSEHCNCSGMSCPWSGLARFNNKSELWPTLALLSDGAIRALALSCQEQPEDRLSELLEKFQKVDTLFKESRKSYLNKVVAWLVWWCPIVRGQSFSPWSCLSWSGWLLLERH